MAFLSNITHKNLRPSPLSPTSALCLSRPCILKQGRLESSGLISFNRKTRRIYFFRFLIFSIVNFVIFWPTGQMKPWQKAEGLQRSLKMARITFSIRINLSIGHTFRIPFSEWNIWRLVKFFCESLNEIIWSWMYTRMLQEPSRRGLHLGPTLV